MKDPKINFALLSTVFAVATYFIIDAAKNAKEKLFRIAAGESNYERTHKKR